MREFKRYKVAIQVNGALIVRGDVEASSPCKAVELFHADNKLHLGPGHSAIAHVSTDVGLKFEFNLTGIEREPACK